MNEERERQAFADLVAVCRRLRGPSGCPWDREQRLDTMTPYLYEEAAEVAEAVALDDPARIHEELGDLMFLGIFCLELLADRAGTGIAESLEAARAKLIRRHPHVYGDTEVRDGGAADHQWQVIKKHEQGGTSVLGEPPRGLAALIAAYRVQEKAAAVGFDWPEVAGPAAKVREEIAEVEQAVERSDPREAAREIGDLLFAVVNLARHLQVDPERELAASTTRFRDRFRHIEQRLDAQGRSFREANLEEMDALWEEAKALRVAEKRT